jgi:hypothetical protein
LYLMFKLSFHNSYLMYTYKLNNWCNNMYLLCINLNSLTLYPLYDWFYKIELLLRYQGVIRSRKFKTDRQYIDQRKTAKEETMIYKTLHRKLYIERHEPHKNGDELRRSGRVEQFLFYYCHPSCYPCYKTCDKSWMRKGRNCDKL